MFNVEAELTEAEAVTVGNALSRYITARLSLRSAVIVFDTPTASRSDTRAQPGETVLSGAFEVGRNYQASVVLSVRRPWLDPGTVPHPGGHAGSRHKHLLWSVHGRGPVWRCCRDDVPGHHPPLLCDHDQCIVFTRVPGNRDKLQQWRPLDPKQ